MDRVLKVGDMLSLEGESNPFQVLSCIEYNGGAYACVYKVPNNIAEILTPEKLEKTFIKEVVVGGNFEIEEVLDNKIKDELNNLILNNANK